MQIVLPKSDDNPMLIDADIAAEKLTEYLYHAITLKELNEWARNAVKSADFGGNDDVLNNVKRMLGPMTWDDCAEVMRELGYSIRIDVFQVDTRMQSGRTRAVPTTAQRTSRRATIRMPKQ